METLARTLRLVLCFPWFHCMTPHNKIEKHHIIHVSVVIPQESPRLKFEYHTFERLSCAFNMTIIVVTAGCSTKTWPYTAIHPKLDHILPYIQNWTIYCHTCSIPDNHLAVSFFFAVLHMLCFGSHTRAGCHGHVTGGLDPWLEDEISFWSMAVSGSLNRW